MKQTTASFTSSANRDQCSTEPAHPGLRTLVENEAAQQSRQAGETGASNRSLSVADQKQAVFVHEVANSLQMIGLAVEFVQHTFATEYPQNPSLNKAMNGALKEIDSLLSLLGDFRSTQSVATLAPVIVDLTTVVEDVLTMQRLACDASNVDIRFESERAPLWASIDVPKMRQLITNLCKNGREAMPRGGQLMIKLQQSGHDVLLQVSDNGDGVRGDVQCFELFKTTKPTGSGVGLALARQIVTAHRGTIDYVSEHGQGTTFTVSLPLITKQGVDLEPRSPAFSNQETSPISSYYE